MDNLKIFSKTVEGGSFSEAARYFDVTPSAVSRQITQLEQELGVRLFHRTTRQQSLTEAGRIYYRYALRILSEIESAKLAVSQLSDQPKGLLMVSAERDFAETFIQPIILEFLDRYPEIQLKLSLDTSIVDLVAGAVDIAVRIGHLEDSALVARKLMESPSVVCASPKYFERHGKPMTPLDLRDHNCLSFRTTTRRPTWNVCFEGAYTEVPITGNLKVNSLALLKDAALKGLGVIFVPLWLVKHEIEHGQLICLNFDSLNTPVYAVFANNKQVAPKLRVFVDFLVEALAKS